MTKENTLMSTSGLMHNAHWLSLSAHLHIPHPHPYLTVGKWKGGHQKLSRKPGFETEQPGKKYNMKKVRLFFFLIPLCHFFFIMLP